MLNGQYNTGIILDPTRNLMKSMGKNGAMATALMAQDKKRQDDIVNAQNAEKLQLLTNADTRQQTEADRLTNQRSTNQALAQQVGADLNRVGQYGNTMEKVAGLNQEMSVMAGLDKNTLDGNHQVTEQEAALLTQTFANNQNMSKLNTAHTALEAQGGYATDTNQEQALADITQQYISAGNDPKTAALFAQAQTSGLTNRTTEQGLATASAQAANEMNMKRYDQQLKRDIALTKVGGTGKNSTTINLGGSMTSADAKNNLNIFKTMNKEQAQDYTNSIVNAYTDDLIGINDKEAAQGMVDSLRKEGVSERAIAMAVATSQRDGKFIADSYLDESIISKAQAYEKAIKNNVNPLGGTTSVLDIQRMQAFNNLANSTGPGMVSAGNLYDTADNYQAQFNSLMNPKAKTTPKPKPKPKPKPTPLTLAQQEAKQLKEDYSFNKEDEVDMVESIKKPQGTVAQETTKTIEKLIKNQKKKDADFAKFFSLDGDTSISEFFGFDEIMSGIRKGMERDPRKRINLKNKFGVADGAALDTALKGLPRQELEELLRGNLSTDDRRAITQQLL